MLYTVSPTLSLYPTRAIILFSPIKIAVGSQNHLPPPMNGSQYVFPGLDLDSRLWTGLLKRCIFDAIALPKRPGGQCHAPGLEAKRILVNCPSN